MVFDTAAASTFNVAVVDFRAENAPELFTKSLKETGFGVLTNHGLDETLIQEVYEEWREFLKELDQGRRAGEGVERPESKEASTEEKEEEEDPYKDVSDFVNKEFPSVCEQVNPKSEARTELLKTAEVVSVDFGGSDGASTATGGATPEGSPRVVEDAVKKVEKLHDAECGEAFSASKVFTQESSALDAYEKYHFDAIKQDGYFPQTISEMAKNHKHKDLKHFYHLYFPRGRYPKEVSLRAKKLWEQMIDLGKLLLNWIDDHMDPEVKAKLPCKQLSDILCPANTLLRVLHYPADKDTLGDAAEKDKDGAVRAAPHEDINLITVLPAGSSKGLQVFSNKDGRWFEVPCIRGSIIINIGDMLQELTQGEYIATTHRVVKPDGEDKSHDRMSTPCFMHPRPDAYLSERYPTSRAFLYERLRELGVM